MICPNGCGKIRLYTKRAGFVIRKQATCKKCSYRYTDFYWNWSITGYAA